MVSWDACAANTIMTLPRTMAPVASTVVGFRGSPSTNAPNAMLLMNCVDPSAAQSDCGVMLSAAKLNTPPAMSRAMPILQMGRCIADGGLLSRGSEANRTCAHFMRFVPRFTPIDEMTMMTAPTMRRFMTPAGPAPAPPLQGASGVRQLHPLAARPSLSHSNPEWRSRGNELVMNNVFRIVVARTVRTFGRHAPATTPVRRGPTHLGSCPRAGGVRTRRALRRCRCDPSCWAWAALSLRPSGPCLTLNDHPGRLRGGPW